MALTVHELRGVSLEVHERGSGAAVVYVHGEDGLMFTSPLLGSLAADAAVHARLLGETPKSARVRSNRHHYSPLETPASPEHSVWRPLSQPDSSDPVSEVSESGSIMKYQAARVA